MCPMKTMPPTSQSQDVIWILPNLVTGETQRIMSLRWMQLMWVKEKLNQMASWKQFWLIPSWALRWKHFSFESPKPNIYYWFLINHVSINERTAAGGGIPVNSLYPGCQAAQQLCISVTCCWMNKGRLDGTTGGNIYKVQQSGTDLLQASFQLLRWYRKWAIWLNCLVKFLWMT